MIKDLRVLPFLVHNGRYMEVLDKIKLLNGADKKIVSAATAFLDIVLPPGGPAGSLHSKQGLTKRTTNPWQGLTFLDEPCCHSCGYPFEYFMGQGQICAPCMANPPNFDRARSALQYHVDSSPLILSFKHGGRTQNLKRFAQQMARAGRAFWPEADLIIPVPLHKSRLRKRRFNQAGLLGRAIASQTNIPFDPHSLKRHKFTVSQGSQTAKGRYRNVRGAFSVADENKPNIKGQNIVLIDDVYTTGATLEACTRALGRAGAEKVFALTLARVVRDQEIPT